MHLLIDSTGLRIHVGHLRKPQRNRAWRKLHLAIDAETGQIVASELTSHRTRDSTQVPALLEQNDNPVASIHADGAYDRKSVYEAAQRKGNGRAVRMLIPPARDARLRAAPLNAHPRPTTMAPAIRLQPAQHGGKYDLPLQNDPRWKHEESRHGRATNRGAARVQDPQPNGTVRNARQLQIAVIRRQQRGICLQLRAMHQRLITAESSIAMNASIVGKMPAFK